MRTLQKFKMLLAASLISGLFFGYPASSQNLDVPYVPTPEEVVDKMLELTNVGPGDYVIDLGSGDGRIVIAAAKRGAVGHGIDLNPVRVKEASENAIKAGVSDKVVFIEGDLFEADVSKATVITMYLLSSVNLKLRPVLLEQLRPGTRLVSHSFSMGEWEADEQAVVNNRNVYYWVIPASVTGTWEWTANGERFTMNATQEFQKVNLQVNAGNRSLTIQDPVLVGERLNFSAIDKGNGNHYVFSGRIDDNRISGTTHIHSGRTGKKMENWSATLRRR
jgi:SAM-dependent methyltransferase